MTTPEIPQDAESLRNSILSKIELLLEGKEAHEHPTELQDIIGRESFMYDVARAIQGRKLTRYGSLETHQGYQWVAISEYSTVRFGKKYINQLIINGDYMADSEGRSTGRHWHYELCKQTYSPEEYLALDKLFDADGQDWNDLFSALADYQKPSPRQQ